MRKHLRATIRDAHSAGNSDEVIRLGREGDDILLEDPDLATLVARALDASGAVREALAMLKAVGAHSAPTVRLLRWTGILAARIADYATAIPAYAALAERPDTPDNLKGEAERFFERAKKVAVRQLRPLAQAGRIDEALELAELIEKQFGPSPLLAREQSRLYKMLRSELKDIEQGDSDLMEREQVLRQIIRLRPDDKAMLRRLALELMRQFRFAEAAEYWENLYALDPDNESADKNRVRCATLAARRSSAAGAELEPVG